MDMNNVNIEEIVKQVLAGMAGTAPAASASAAPAAPAAAPAGAIPKTAHVAVLTEKEHFDIKEYPIPAIGDDDILVKVEAAAFAVLMLTNSRETHSTDPGCTWT